MSELKQLGPLWKTLAWSVVDLPTGVSVSISKVKGSQSLWNFEHASFPTTMNVLETSTRTFDGLQTVPEILNIISISHMDQTRSEEAGSNTSSIQWQPKNASERKSSAEDICVQAKRHNMLFFSSWDI